MRERNKCWVNNHYLELISPSLYLFCIAEEPEPLKRNRTHSLPFKMGLNLEKPSWNIILYLIILNNILKFGFKWISDHVAIFIFSESLFFLKIKLFLNHRGDSLFFFLLRGCCSKCSQFYLITYWSFMKTQCFYFLCISITLFI